MADLKIEKPQNMLVAHLDGIYRFEARGEDFAVDLAVDLLATMQREAKLLQWIDYVDRVASSGDIFAAPALYEIKESIREIRSEIPVHKTEDNR